MAHEVEIVCYDGTNRTPRIMERYRIRRGDGRPPEPVEA